VEATKGDVMKFVTATLGTIVVGAAALAALLVSEEASL